MGSLFLVTIPTREYEKTLRLKEKKIQIITEELREPYGNGNLQISPASSSTSKSVWVSSGLQDGKDVRILTDENEIKICKGDEAFKEDDEYEDKIANTFMQKHMEDCLKKFRVDNSTRTPCGGNFHQFTFTLPGELAEPITNYLQTVGIGKKYESSIWVGSSAFYTNPGEKDEGDILEERNSKKGSKPWSGFIASIRSRLTVAEVVQSVKSGAMLTFDYIMLVIVAGIIAGLGLVDNSSVNVVASMLVSPLMGPIMAGTFGAMIRDRELIRIGLVNELIGLFLCLVVGLIFGLVLQIPPMQSTGPYSLLYLDNWPTQQMASRGQFRGLWVGLWVAIPSGVGVALSILAGNSGSLVGVAISASLLPPAVNCGIYFGMALAITMKETGSLGLGCDQPLATQYTVNYTPIYCQNIILDYLWNGLISFGLTMVNIIVIFAVGLVVLKIKEVAPHTTKNSLEKFWKEDIKAAREANAKGKDILQEIADATEEEKAEVLEKLEMDPTYTAVRRHTAYGTGLLEDFRQRGAAAGSSVGWAPNNNSPNLARKNQQQQPSPWQPRKKQSVIFEEGEEEEEIEMEEKPQSQSKSPMFGRPSRFYSIFRLWETEEQMDVENQGGKNSKRGN